MPAQFHYLDPVRFNGGGMMVHFVKERPVQGNGTDCGVYMCKYIDDMLNGISLREAVWGNNLDIVNFRYHITWEVYKGETRRIRDYGIKR